MFPNLPTFNRNCNGADRMKEITSLRDATRELLINRPASISPAEVAKAIGVSTSWVNSFARGDISNPGVVTIETLNAFLKNLNNKKAVNK